ncbi:MAG: hypothetical protein VX777_08165 [Chlamydiota bacterium]|nr:hypothetical protein [Chlamydiota bacterium]
MIVTECPEKFLISFQKYFHEELSNSKIAKIVAETLDFIKTVVKLPLRYLGSKSWSLPGIIFRTPIALFKRIIGVQQNRSLCQEIFGSGYQHQPTKLSIEGTKKYIRTVTVATAAHNLSVKWRTAIAAFGLNVLSPVDVFCEDLKTGELKNIDVDKNRFFDSNSGLKAILVSNREELFISFAALGGARVEIDDKKECEALEKKIWKKFV